MEHVEIGIMLPGAKRFNDLNVNETWKASIYTTTGETKIAYVKKVLPRSLYVESVCAVIGRCLDLPIPKPIIVQIPKGVTEGIEHDMLGFGSEDAKYPSFRRAINVNDQQAMLALENYSKILDVSVFDEWIANNDRNQGNILFDGKDDFVFIDHEKSIPDLLPYSKPADKNELLNCFFSMLDEFNKYKCSKEVESKYVPSYKNIPLNFLTDATSASMYLEENEISQVILFLQNRISSMVDLFNQRINMKQQRMPI